MNLLDQEIFGLKKIFDRQDEFDSLVISQLNVAVVVERKVLSTGFFLTIRFPKNFPKPNLMQWDWNFDHKDLMEGGSYIACFEPPNIIEMEAVVHYGEWPSSFDPADFSDA